MGLHLSSHSGTVSAKESAVFYVPNRPNSNQTQSEPLKRRSVSRSRSLHEDRHNRLPQEPVAGSRRFSLQSVQRPDWSCYNENPGEGPAPSFVSEGITDSLVLLRAELHKCKRTTSEHSWTEKLSFKKLSGGIREKTLCRGDTAKRSPNWNFWKRKSKMKKVSEDISEALAPVSSGAGISTGARLEVETEMSSDTDTSDFQDFGNSPDQIQLVPVESLRDPIIDLSRFNPEDYPIEDFEERARQERAREMAEGVDPPPGFRPGSAVVTPGVLAEIHLNNLTTLFHNSLTMNLPSLNALTHISSDLQLLAAQHGLGSVLPHTSASRGAHTQVDYIHCLVPDLLDITLCSFYWWKMDRYEAERLLDNKPDGTFLLRDSAQEEYLFSVSFRRYSRSLHARIEQWNHKFSFDSHDPGVFASPSVCGLMEHYKDPSCCMFFEPMLTIPLLRTFVFPLQHLCRAVICKSTTYDGISSLQLPKPLKVYLKEYHYKQRVRVRRLEAE